MSYILDALRRSEIDRNEGQVPDLGQPSALLHLRKPRRARWPWVIAGVLVLVNVGVVAWLVLARAPLEPVMTVSSTALSVPAVTASAPSVMTAPAPVMTPPVMAPAAPVPYERASSAPVASQIVTPVQPIIPESSVSYDEAVPLEADADVSSEIAPPVSGTPVLYYGDGGQPLADAPEPSGVALQSSVPFIQEMDLAFQRRVPDLRFNSHIYSSNPSSRRVMINDQYLREGQQFAGLTVEEITEDGVVLALDGQSFSVSVVHDWIAPR